MVSMCSAGVLEDYRLVRNGAFMTHRNELFGNPALSSSRPVFIEVDYELRKLLAKLVRAVSVYPMKCRQTSFFGIIKPLPHLANKLIYQLTRHSWFCKL